MTSSKLCPARLQKREIKVSRKNNVVIIEVCADLLCALQLSVYRLSAVILKLPTPCPSSPMLAQPANLLIAVSWNWGGGAPGGKVAETKEHGEIAIQSKRGNTIKKNAEPDNPAVHIARSGNDVVKRASELNVEEKASGSNGKKREAEDEGPITENAEGKDVKKQKTEKKSTKTDKKNTKAEEKKQEEEKEEGKAEKKETNGEKKEEKKEEPKKKAGRPKGNGNAAEKKKKESKPRATEGIGSRTRSRA